jgi:hypothetical protein
MLKSSSRYDHVTGSDGNGVDSREPAVMLVPDEVKVLARARGDVSDGVPSDEPIW